GNEIDSRAMNVAGEPSTGNLYTRFDEGRGGQAYGLVPSSTLPKYLTKIYYRDYSCFRSMVIIEWLVVMG
ncbi:MAG: hypothetical protein ACI9DF_005241, partial [Verrucomicrobiales bacterium]